MPKKIFVSQPSLAPLEDYRKLLEQAWNSKILTHNGPMVQELERKVNDFLGVDHTVAVTNGTIALQLAIRALQLKGEIITSPFSWIATCSAIRWEGCNPVFTDVEPGTFNMDPTKIEATITSNTVAIMPVHVFSCPVDMASIEAIAKKHGLKVIYDAAHAFGVKQNGRSVMDYGDISCTSFHATKIFNSGEGGACHARDPEIKERLKQLRFFGHNDQKDVVEDGINGKMTEIHAALGLVNLPLLPKVINHRKSIFVAYHQRLSQLECLTFQQFDPEAYNYSYLPVIFESEEQLQVVMKHLMAKDIYPRRYFYPSLNKIPTLGSHPSMPVSESLSARILCLPSHNYIDEEGVDRVCEIIEEVQLSGIS